MNYGFRDFTIVSLFSEIHYKFLMLLRIYYELVICYANSLWFHYQHAFITFLTEFPWIHYLFRKITIYSLSVTRIHYGISTFLANSLWIHYLLQKLFSIHYPLVNANSPWIHHHFRQFRINPLFFGNFQMIYYLSEFWIDLLSFA